MFQVSVYHCKSFKVWCAEQIPLLKEIFAPFNFRLSTCFFLPRQFISIYLCESSIVVDDSTLKKSKERKKCHSFGKILRTKCMCGRNEDHFPVRYFSIANYEIENDHYSTREAQNLVSQLRNRKVACLQMGNHQKYGS